MPSRRSPVGRSVPQLGLSLGVRRFAPHPCRQEVDFAGTAEPSLAQQPRIAGRGKLLLGIVLRWRGYLSVSPRVTGSRPADINRPPTLRNMSGNDLLTRRSQTPRGL